MRIETEAPKTHAIQATTRGAQHAKVGTGSALGVFETFFQQANAAASGKLSGGTQPTSASPNGTQSAAVQDLFASLVGKLTGERLDQFQQQIESLVQKIDPELRDKLEAVASQQLGDANLSEVESKLDALAERMPELKSTIDELKSRLETAAQNGSDASAETLGAALLVMALQRAANSNAIHAPTNSKTPASEQKPKPVVPANNAAQAKQEVEAALRTAAGTTTSVPTETATASSTKASLLARFLPSGLVSPKSAATDELKPVLTNNLKTSLRELLDQALQSAKSELADQGATNREPASSLLNAVEHSLRDLNDDDPATSRGSTAQANSFALPSATESSSTVDAAPANKLSNHATRVIEQVRTLTQQLLGRLDATVQREGDVVSTKLQLNPVELGQVQVNLSVTGDHTVAAQIVAQRPETAALLEGNVRQLTESLTRQGFSVERVQVSVASVASTQSAARGEHQSFQQHEGQTARQWFEQQQREQRMARRQPAFAFAEETA